jgi:hypothetical protein
VTTGAAFAPPDCSAGNTGTDRAGFPHTRGKHMTTKTERTRALNDALRTGGSGGRLMLTRGIAALPINELRVVFDAVQSFSDFNADNDPYGEHDCALLTAAGHNIMFKVDYYDPTMTGGSEDPSDPSQTCRVLTILLASEY